MISDIHIKIPRVITTVVFAIIGIVSFWIVASFVIPRIYHAISSSLDEDLARYLGRLSGDNLCYKYVELGILFCLAVAGAFTGIVVARKIGRKTDAEKQAPHPLD